MNRKPDVIRALVVVFAVGLMISGLTSLAASDSSAAAGSGNDLSTIMSQQNDSGSAFRNN